METSITVFKPFAQNFAQNFVEQVQAFNQPYVTKEVVHSFKASQSYSKKEWLRDTLEETQLKYRIWTDLHNIFGLNFFKRHSDSNANYIKHLTYQIELQQYN